MKLAILGTRGIPARYGGFETFAERISIGLVELGHQVTVYCDKGTSTAQPAEYCGVQLRYRSAPDFGPLTTILHDLSCLWDARKDFDIVYMLGYGAAPFCLIPRLWGSRVWINPDGLEWARSKWGPMARTYFRLMEWVSVRVANHIIADAAAIASSLISRHGPLRSNSIIPYGCEIHETTPAADTLENWGLTRRAYHVVVCRLEPENHVYEILQAFQQSQSQKQLVVVGNHTVPTRYVQQLLAVKDSRIRFVGTIYDQDELACLRSHAFAYFHGHSVGGTNPSLLEAMGCANLIYAHDNPFNRETLDDCGGYFDSVASLTQIFDELESPDMSVESLRQAARSRAATRFSWPAIIAQYARLMEEPK